jgi:hypothetical protein
MESSDSASIPWKSGVIDINENLTPNVMGTSRDRSDSLGGSSTGKSNATPTVWNNTLRTDMTPTPTSSKVFDSAMLTRTKALGVSFSKYLRSHVKALPTPGNHSMDNSKFTPMRDMNPDDQENPYTRMLSRSNSSSAPSTGGSAGSVDSTKASPPMAAVLSPRSSYRLARSVFESKEKAKRSPRKKQQQQQAHHVNLFESDISPVMSSNNSSVNSASAAAAAASAARARLSPYAAAIAEAHAEAETEGQADAGVVSLNMDDTIMPHSDEQEQSEEEEEANTTRSSISSPASSATHSTNKHNTSSSASVSASASATARKAQLREAGAADTPVATAMLLIPSTATAAASPSNNKDKSKSKSEDEEGDRGKQKEESYQNMLEQQQRKEEYFSKQHGLPSSAEEPVTMISGASKTQAGPVRVTLASRRFSTSFLLSVMFLTVGVLLYLIARLASPLAWPVQVQVQSITSSSLSGAARLAASSELYITEAEEEAVPSLVASTNEDREKEWLQCGDSLVDVGGMMIPAGENCARAAIAAVPVIPKVGLEEDAEEEGYEIAAESMGMGVSSRSAAVVAAVREGVNNAVSHTTGALRTVANKLDADGAMRGKVTQSVMTARFKMNQATSAAALAALDKIQKLEQSPEFGPAVLFLKGKASQVPDELAQFSVKMQATGAKVARRSLRATRRVAKKLGRETQKHLLQLHYFLKENRALSEEYYG